MCIYAGPVALTCIVNGFLFLILWSLLKVMQSMFECMCEVKDVDCRANTKYIDKTL